MSGLLVALAVVVALYVAAVLVLVAASRGARARELALFIPNLVLLFRGLTTDARVPRRARIAVFAALAYFAVPIDLVPDFIPVAGALDDAIIAALVLRFVLSSTPRTVLDGHWRGDPRTLQRLLSAVGA